MPVLPFHRYIGPGNDINSGPCVDADDCIAKKHDIAYENAKTPQDVRAADVVAIEEFRRSWMSGNWHSLIGDVGLSLKYCVETYTGVIYPKLADDYQPCEIVGLFKDLIRLHCVNKVKLVDQYARPIQEDLDPKRILHLAKTTNDHTMDNLIFFILVTWYQHNRTKLGEFSKPFYLFDNVLFDNVIQEMPLKQIMRYSPKQYNPILNNCDIFNIKTWIRFLAAQRSKNVSGTSNEYNDEELSNMFMIYD